MPGGDRTGPMGAGPKTGRSMGVCAGFSNPGDTSPYQGGGRIMRGGRGMRRGFGRGLGRRGWNVSLETANTENTDKKQE